MTTDAASPALPPGLSPAALTGVFNAVGGLRNRRAIVALLGCLLAGVLLGGGLFALGGVLGGLAGLLGGLVYLVAVATGVNAAGLLQMDRARGVAERSLGDALAGGLLCLPKLLLLAIAFLAVEIVVFIVLALLLLICKIPFLGPLLFVVVFPFSVVVAGLTVCGLALCGVLTLPAIWQGLGIGAALTQTLAVVRSRLVETALLLVFLIIVCSCVSLVIFGVLGAGLLPVLSMSATTLGFAGGAGGGLVSLLAGGGGGIVVAGLIGTGVLWAIALSLVGQVYLLGIAIVYVRVTEGVDVGAAAAALRGSVDEARRRTAALAEKASPPPAAAVAPLTAAASPPPPAALAREAVPPTPPTPPTFEAMQSAAFGGSLAPRPAFHEATQTFAPPPPAPPPMAPPRLEPIDALADLDLPFDDAPPPAAAPSPTASASPATWSEPASRPEGTTRVDLSYEAVPSTARVVPPARGNVDLPLEAPASLERIDLSFDDPAPEPGLIDLPFDDLVAAAPAATSPAVPAASTLPREAAPAPAASTPPAPPASPAPPAAPTPAYAAPPAWMPPPATPAAAAPALPPMTTCPQCLSAVLPADMFCGVCGFRLK